MQKIIPDTREQELRLPTHDPLIAQAGQVSPTGPSSDNVYHTTQQASRPSTSTPPTSTNDPQPSPNSARRSEFPTPPGIEMSEIFPGVVKPVTERIVYEWRSPARVFKKRNKTYFTNMVTIVLLLSLILFFSGQAMAVAVILSVAFMAYVMTSIPPHDITQKITTYGVRIEDKIYYWEELGRFWFETKSGQTVLKIEVARFPNQLSLVVASDEQKQQISQYMSDVLLQQKPEPTTTDKLAEWLTKKFPIDLEKA